jgi:hypothetical protein
MPKQMMALAKDSQSTQLVLYKISDNLGKLVKNITDLHI